MTEDIADWLNMHIEQAEQKLISKFLDDYKKYITKDTDTEFYKKWEEKLK